MVAAKSKGAALNESAEPVTNLTNAEEVAERSPDAESAGDKFEKDYVVVASKWSDEDWAHEANIEATRQSAINAGVRPTEHGAFVGSEEHPDGVSLILHYEVGAVPAHEEDAPQVKVIEDPENESAAKLEDAQK